MTMKITKTGRGSERNDESLLFEWLNHEVPESIKLSYETSLNTNRFAGSLQTNQIVGIYLEPITFSGEFFGEYISKNNNKSLEYITAKERSDQLARLQGRIIKFWFEGIKQLVIIQKYEIDIKNYNHVEYTITLQPHDIQLPISPIEVKQYLTKSFIQTGEPLVKPEKFEGKAGTISFLPNGNFKVSEAPPELTQLEKINQAYDRKIAEYKRLNGVSQKLNPFNASDNVLFDKIKKKRETLSNEIIELKQKLDQNGINRTQDANFKLIESDRRINNVVRNSSPFGKGYK